MLLDGAGEDKCWSSRDLPAQEALRTWKHWACDTLAPMHIDVPDESGFAAHWRSRTLGPLQLIELVATPQRVAHSAEENARTCEPAFQLVYCKRTPMSTRVGLRRFDVGEEEFVLLNNAQSYEVRMEDTNVALDLVIPGSWLMRWLPDPGPYVAKPCSAMDKWGRPFGAFLTTLWEESRDPALPHGVIADQIGGLLTLAFGLRPASGTRHKAALVRRILQLIRDRHDDPELDPADAARTLGVSKRYLHALLAESGTTFGGALAGIRLDRASELLSNGRFAQLQIGEVALKCGYLDPSYFARAFRRRFGAGPREWRKARCQ
jgi:AraC-like DNA-binding protein